MNFRKVILSAALLSTAACSTDEEPPLRITGAYIPTESCDDSGQDSGGTSVDIAFHTSALVGFRYESDEVPAVLSSNGDTLAGPERNDVILHEREISYENSAEIALDTKTEPIYIYTRAAGSGNFVIDLLTSQAVQALSAALPNPGDSADILAKFRFRGKRSHGGGTIETREIRFPITVFRSNFSCPPGETLKSTGPCGSLGGQAGAPYECEEVD